MKIKLITYGREEDIVWVGWAKSKLQALKAGLDSFVRTFTPKPGIVIQVSASGEEDPGAILVKGRPFPLYFFGKIRDPFPALGVMGTIVQGTPPTRITVEVETVWSPDVRPPNVTTVTETYICARTVTVYVGRSVEDREDIEVYTGTVTYEPIQDEDNPNVVIGERTTYVDFPEYTYAAGEDPHDGVLTIYDGTYERTSIAPPLDGVTFAIEETFRDAAEEHLAELLEEGANDDSMTTVISTTDGVEIGAAQCNVDLYGMAVSNLPMFETEAGVRWAGGAKMQLVDLRLSTDPNEAIYNGIAADRHGLGAEIELALPANVAAPENARWDYPHWNPAPYFMAVDSEVERPLFRRVFGSLDVTIVKSIPVVTELTLTAYDYETTLPPGGSTYIKTSEEGDYVYYTIVASGTYASGGAYIHYLGYTQLSEGYIAHYEVMSPQSLHVVNGAIYYRYHKNSKTVPEELGRSDDYSRTPLSEIGAYQAMAAYASARYAQDLEEYAAAFALEDNSYNTYLSKWEEGKEEAKTRERARCKTNSDAFIEILKSGVVPPDLDFMLKTEHPRTERARLTPGIIMGTPPAPTLVKSTLMGPNSFGVSPTQPIKQEFTRTIPITQQILNEDGTYTSQARSMTGKHTREWRYAVFERSYSQLGDQIVVVTVDTFDDFPIYGDEGLGLWGWLSADNYLCLRRAGARYFSDVPGDDNTPGPKPLVGYLNGVVVRNQYWLPASYDIGKTSPRGDPEFLTRVTPPLPPEGIDITYTHPDWLVEHMEGAKVTKLETPTPLKHQAVSIANGETITVVPLIWVAIYGEVGMFPPVADRYEMVSIRIRGYAKFKYSKSGEFTALGWTDVPETTVYLEDGFIKEVPAYDPEGEDIDGDTRFYERLLPNTLCFVNSVRWADLQETSDAQVREFDGLAGKPVDGPIDPSTDDRLAFAVRRAITPDTSNS